MGFDASLSSARGSYYLSTTQNAPFCGKTDFPCFFVCVLVLFLCILLFCFVVVIVLIGYSFRLAARVLLYASSHRQDNTYPLPPHRLLFPIRNKGSFICIIPQTG